MSLANRSIVFLLDDGNELRRGLQLDFGYQTGKQLFGLGQNFVNDYRDTLHGETAQALVVLDRFE